MSVVGFDFGQQNCYIAVARQGGVEVITNDYSLHATPSCVQFDERSRVAGVAARQKLISKLKQTAANIKHLIGRKYSDPIAQQQRIWLPCEMVQLPDDDGIGLQVLYLNEKRVFTPEQVLAMILIKLAHITEAALASSHTLVSDCVLAVPSHFTQTQRALCLDAVRLANLNPLRIINEMTAVALAYGMYKKDLPPKEEKPRKLMFVDMGHSQAQIAICDLNMSKLVMRGTVFDLELGGREFDKLIVERMCDEFKQRYNIDVRSSRRHYFRLTDEVEKLRKQMSANSSELPLNIESFMDDKDVRSGMQRSDFEALAAPLFDRFRQLLRRCLAETKTRKDSIDVIELVGGAMRTPMLRQIVTEEIGREPVTTMNMDEAVARGAAIQCAILSPVFKTKDFEVTDALQYRIKMRWSAPLAEGGFSEMDVYETFHPFPASKKMTFMKSAPFDFECGYGDPDKLPYPVAGLGRYTIEDVTPLADGTGRKVYVKMNIDHNGLFGIRSAVAIEDAPKNASEPGNAEANAETNAAASPAAETDASQEPAAKSKQKKAKTVEKPLQLREEYLARGLSESLYNSYKLMEEQMQARDIEEKAKSDARNAVEEYVYEMRDKLSDQLRPYATEQDAEVFSSLLSATEDWLYGEGEDCATDVYVKKLQELRGYGDPIVERYQEAISRPAAFERLGAAIQQARKVLEQALAGVEAYNHLEPKELDKVRKACDEKQAWLDEKAGKCASRPLTEPPPVLTSQITAETTLFEDCVRPIIYRPKPKPKQPPPPETNGDVNMDGTGQQPPSSEGTAKTGAAPPSKDGEQNGMEVDEADTAAAH